MKKFLPAMTAGLWSLLGHAALAQSSDVSADAYAAASTPISRGLLGAGIVFMIVYLAIVIFLFVTWIRMIVHAAKNNIENKGMWLVVVILFNWIGAVIYYFAVKRPMDKKMHPAPAKV